MAIKKSDLYSSLWASCDELRGGMDASQYKDYVLFMLFIKYISDKYADFDGFDPPVKIPKGASFQDMVALKGKSDIGDKINIQIIQPLIDANARLARSDFPDFNDPNKLGEGEDMVEKLSNLVGIFQKPELDFSQNRAEHDDILGDAYEYLMRHFASESGKSKGQFYTPSEVSRIIVGEVGYVPDDFPTLNLPDRLWMTRFDPNSDVCARWLAYVMSCPQVKENIKGLATGTSGSMKNIGKGKLLALQLEFPAGEEQTAIAAVLSGMDAELSKLEARRDKTRDLKQAMKQELLTGRIRLL